MYLKWALSEVMEAMKCHCNTGGTKLYKKTACLNCLHFCIHAWFTNHIAQSKGVNKFELKIHFQMLQNVWHHVSILTCTWGSPPTTCLEVHGAWGRLAHYYMELTPSIIPHSAAPDGAGKHLLGQMVCLEQHGSVCKLPSMNPHADQAQSSTSITKGLLNTY